MNNGFKSQASKLHAYERAKVLKFEVHKIGRAGGQCICVHPKFEDLITSQASAVSI
jgi:hypothetical protein